MAVHLKPATKCQEMQAHGNGAHHDDVGSVSILQELGGCLELLARTAVDLGGDLRELAGNVGCVAVEHGSIAVANLAGVVHDNDLTYHSNTSAVKLPGYKVCRSNEAEAHLSTLLRSLASFSHILDHKTSL